jgi:predicted Zn-dependent protease with MMP-like domain
VLEVSLPEFEAMVAEAVNTLPDDFRAHLDNVDFAVEEWARPEDYRLFVLPGATLLGVYRGVSRTRRGSGYNMTLPDVIVIFRQPIQRMASDEEDLRARVRHVVLHEIAHHFGISDERLREIDAY